MTTPDKMLPPDGYTFAFGPHKNEGEWICVLRNTNGFWISAFHNENGGCERSSGRHHNRHYNLREPEPEYEYKAQGLIDAGCGASSGWCYSKKSAEHSLANSVIHLRMFRRIKGDKTGESIEVIEG